MTVGELNRILEGIHDDVEVHRTVTTDGFLFAYPVRGAGFAYVERDERHSRLMVVDGDGEGVEEVFILT